MASKEALLAVLAGSGQEHLLDSYDTLSADAQASLTAQVESYTNAQWRHMNSILRDSLEHLRRSTAAAATATAADTDSTSPSALHIAPPPAETVIDMPALLAAEAPELAAIRTAGLGVVARGEAAVLLMAGGSGTRLGVSIPKGLFECDHLVSGRSLFEYHCHRIRKVEMMAGSVVSLSATTAAGAAGRGTLPLLVMTSDQNDAETQSFFRSHHYFGLQPSQVYFFRQSSLPCYDEATGRVLVEAPGRLCLAPGGNGGVYESLVKAGATSPPAEVGVLAQLKARGVHYVQIFSVDNILARLGDPYFFGIAATRQAEVVLKTVPKAAATERVGVVAKVDGEWCVVEYTEIGAERSAEVDTATGELAFNCGNIASHCCSVDFLELAARHMETSTFYHAAHKTISTINGPRPAVKLEAFIFDLFRYAKDVPSRTERAAAGELPDAFQIMQVDRSKEFAPIKNADGAAADTPTTAANLILALHTTWVTAAITAAPEASEAAAAPYTPQERATAVERLRGGQCRWEVSPLVSYEGEGLAAYVGELVRRTAAAAAGSTAVLSLEEVVHNRANM